MDRNKKINIKININRFEPKASLKNLIDYIWIMQSDFLTDENRKDIIMPLGHINMIFNYESEYALIEGKRERVIPDVAIIGQIKDAKNVRYGPSVRQIGISLTPEGFVECFKMPGIGIAEQIIDADDFDTTLRVLRDEIESLIGMDAKLEKMYQWVESKAVSDKNSSRLGEMSAYIMHHCEHLNIGDMAAFFSVSVSALERFFKKYVGLTPKTYGEIVKFRKNIEGAEWRESMRNYYYDQSHLMKNTKKLTTKTFNELRNVENELTLSHLLKSKKL